MMDPDEIRARLRRERLARHWDVPDMARALRKAGHKSAPDVLLRAVRRWERTGRIGERNRILYGKAFDLDVDQLFERDENGDPVRRREFLSLAIAAPLVDPQRSGGRRVGRTLVDQLRARTARLRRLDDIMGGNETYPVYASELASTRTLVRQASYTEETGRGLLSVVAEQAQQAGWASFDAGRQDHARGLFKDSMDAATDAGDMSLLGNSLAHLAYVKISAHKPATAEADASCRVIAPDTPAAVQALLYERAAWAHARSGPSHQHEVEQALDHAADALGRGADRPGPDWATWVDGRELQIMTGRCWSELHRPDRAVPALTIALSGFDDTHARDKALYSTWLASALLDAGEIERAAIVLGQAADLAAGVASVRPGRRIATVARRLAPHRSLPAVAELLDRLPTPPSSG